jgi:phytoene synthase
MSSHHQQVAQSYLYCRQVVRRSGSNFSLAFMLLPRAQRLSMYALYAFAREVDDLADGATPVEHRREAIEHFQTQFVEALEGRPAGPIMPAVRDTIQRFAVPVEHFREIVRGVQMDLDHRGFETFEELRTYCLHVASAVGLACLPIWGVKDSRATQPAIDCGIAFQLTNIIRDVHEDAQLGRLYLPREDLHRIGCQAEDLFDGAHLQRVVELLTFQIDRAVSYYRSAAELQQHLTGPPKRVYSLMYGRYAEILQEIAAKPERVLSSKIRLGFLKKLSVATRSIAGLSPLVPSPIQRS